MYILSQVLVVIADILFVTSMFSKKKIVLVSLLFSSDIIFASHYLCLGGLTGATTIFIDLLYLIVMFILEKLNKTKFNLIPTLIAMALTILVSALSWQGIISLLPMFSMLIYLLGMIFTNLIFVKSGALLRNVLNIIYMILLTSFLGASLELCLAICTIVALVVTIKNHKTKNQNTIEKV